MKKLIIISVFILANNLVFGQFYSDTNVNIVYGDNTVTLAPPLSDTIWTILGGIYKPLIPFIAPCFENDYIVTLNDLIQYETECYNDSTKHRVHKDIQGFGGRHISDMCWSYGDGCANDKHYEYKWFHREPTFEGFIKYLQGKE